MDTAYIFVILILFLVLAVVILSVLLVKQSNLKREMKAEFQIDREELISEHRKEIRDIHEIANKEIEAANSECEKRIADEKLSSEKEIQEVKEYIESHREQLEKMDEKTLLANVMIALEGYSHRFARIENALAQEEITSIFQKYICTVREEIDKLADSISDDIAAIKSKVYFIAAAIDDENDSNSVAGKVDSIKSDVEWVRICIDDVQSSLADAKMSSDDAKTAAEEAKSAAEDAKSAAEEARDAINLNSSY